MKHDRRLSIRPRDGVWTPRRVPSVVLILGVGASLGACALGPTYVADPSGGIALPQALPSAPVGGSDLEAWWTSFSDPALTDLVDRALAANTDVAAAEARLRQARAQTRNTRAGLFPRVQAQASATETVEGDALGGDETQFQAGLDASWDVDLFGGTRSAVAASRATEGARQANLASARLSVTGEVARQYVSLRRAQERERVARENIALLTDTLQLVRWRREAGLATATDESQARQQVEQARSSLGDRIGDRRSALNALTTLLGTPPGAEDDRLLTPGSGIPSTSLALAGRPADVLRNRPDVAASERALAAEVANIGVQRAALFPSLSLTGSLTGSGSDAQTLFDDPIGQIAASLSQLIFDAGGTRAALAAQRASADAALADYRGTVLSALEDVDNAFAEAAAADAALIELRAAALSAREAVNDLRAQFEAGLIDVSSLLDAQRTLVSATDSLVQAEARQTLSRITIIQALGGDPRLATGASS